MTERNAPHLDDSHDDGLVHSHGWASEPAIAPSLHRQPQVAAAHAVPTPSTAYHDDRQRG